MQVKNTSGSPLDCGGRMLPAGETADLDPTSPVVAEHLESGRLTAVQTPPKPASKPAKES